MIANKDEALIRAIRNHCCSGNGKNVTLEELSVTQNGEYTPDSGKAYSKVSVNVSDGGSGKVNMNDIILADDLLEKCKALDFSGVPSVTTDWTFSDICVQDSCGVLQSAFEDSDKIAGSFGIESSEKNMEFDGRQAIRITDEENSTSYIIAYNNGKYIVSKPRL